MPIPAKYSYNKLTIHHIMDTGVEFAGICILWLKKGIIKFLIAVKN